MKKLIITILVVLISMSSTWTAIKIVLSLSTMEQFNPIWLYINVGLITMLFSYIVLKND